MSEQLMKIEYTKKLPFWIYYKVCLIFSEISLLEIKQVLINNVISDLYCLYIDFI